MARITIGGLFPDLTSGETALNDLQQAHFFNAHVRVSMDDNETRPVRTSNQTEPSAEQHTERSALTAKLVAQGLSDADAQYFADGVARGGVLVTVTPLTRASEAVEILQRNGADMASASTRPIRDAADRTMQLRAERLAVDKVRVTSGAVRVRKRVVAEEQSLDVVVFHEELVIERRPVTRSTAGTGGAIGIDETIVVPLSREEVKLGKQTFVTEEVDIGKRAVTETTRLSEIVRHEELVVDRGRNELRQ